MQMTKAEILSRMTEIARSIFDDEGLILSYETTAEDVDQWDSIQNIHLILAIEESFGVRFSTSEVIDLQVVGDLVDCVSSKLEKE